MVLNFPSRINIFCSSGNRRKICNDLTNRLIMLLAVFIAMRGLRDTRLTMQTGKENEAMPDLRGSIVLRGNDGTRLLELIAECLDPFQEFWERTIFTEPRLLHTRHILHEHEIRFCLLDNIGKR